MDTLTLTVTEAQAGRTVESLLRRELSLSAGRVSSAKFRPDGIRVNGERVRVTARVRAGDVLTVAVSDRRGNAAAPEGGVLPILWEDGYFAILDKPAGMAVYGARSPTVAGILAEKWGKDTAFHPVNRLDVGTTGLMVAARDGYTHDRLRRCLHTEDFQREYLAVVQGAWEGRGVIELPISRRPVEGTRRSVDPAGLPSRTEYEVLRVSRGRSLVRLRLYTGRTHQIRVHCAAWGHPLAGDALYGAADLPLPRPALHSHHLLLTHPVTGERLDLTAPLPEDMQALL